MSSGKAIVLTRPEPANSEFANELAKFPITAKIIKFPLAKYTPLEFTMPEFEQFDLAIVTSKAALRFLDLGNIKLPWVVVGNQSDELLQQNGAKLLGTFKTAEELSNEFEALSFQRAIYFCGQTIQFDIAKRAKAFGREVDECVVYDVSDFVTNSPEELQDLDEVLFPIFSKQSYLRLLRHWHDFPSFGATYILPISTRLHDYIEDNPPQSGQNASLLMPPKHPTRAEFLKRLIELTD